MEGEASSEVTLMVHLRCDEDLDAAVSGWEGRIPTKHCIQTVLRENRWGSVARVGKEWSSGSCLGCWNGRR